MVHVVRPGDADGAVASHVTDQRGRRLTASGHVVGRQLEPCWLYNIRFVNWVIEDYFKS
jgi:hypothetical protein